MPGSATTFELGGPNRRLEVPARIVRSGLTGSAGHLRYQVAAAFFRELDRHIFRPNV
jgi:hypothetical protein